MLLCRQFFVLRRQPCDARTSTLHGKELTMGSIKHRITRFLLASVLLGSIAAVAAPATHAAGPSSGSAQGAAPSAYLGYPIAPNTTPSVVSQSGNRLDVFVVGADHALYHKAWTGSRWLPSSTTYEYLGGQIAPDTSPSVVSWGANRLDVFWVGADHALHHKAWTGSQWWPSGTDNDNLGGQIAPGTSPSAVSWGANRLDVFVVGPGQALYHRYWAGSQWLPLTTYDNLGGQIAPYTSPSAVSWGANRLDVFVVGPGQALYHRYWAGSQWLPLTTYDNLGGQIAPYTSPSAVSWGVNRLDAFVVGPGQGLYHRYWAGSQWLPLTTYENLGPVPS
jgi:hypothetical protein